MRVYHHIVFVRDGMQLVSIHGTLVKSFDLTKSYRMTKIIKYYR
jgi:hypothetical protein